MIDDREGTTPALLSAPPAQPSVMRWQNLSAILRSIRSGGPLSRSDLAELTGVTAGTVTRLTASLLHAGVLVEVPELRTGGDNGRPRRPLDLNRRNRAVLGIHIGLQYTTVAAVDLGAGLLVERQIEHASPDVDSVVTEAVLAARQVADELPAWTVFGAGVSTGGTVDYDTGVLVHHPALGWRDVPLRSRMAAGLGLPIEYDSAVRALALYESTYGSGRDVEHLLNVFVGNVLDSAFVMGGQVYRGPGSTAGTVTHLAIRGVRGPACSCGRTNCYQAVASNVGVLAIGRATGVLGPHETYAALEQRWSAGDAQVARLLRRRAGWVGQAVALLVDVLNPQLAVLSGKPTQEAGLLEVVRRSAASHSELGAAIAPRIQLATLQHQLPISSAALFLDRCFRDPALLDSGLLRLRSNAGG
jgi:predicted NBD/HSP70 family sugar kinase